MRPYSILLHDGSNDTPSLHVITAMDDEGARFHAADQLNRKPKYRFAEVIRDDDTSFRVTPGSAGDERPIAYG